MIFFLIISSAITFQTTETNITTKTRTHEQYKKHITKEFMCQPHPLQSFQASLYYVTSLLVHLEDVFKLSSVNQRKINSFFDFWGMLSITLMINPTSSLLLLIVIQMQGEHWAFRLALVELPISLSSSFPVNQKTKTRDALIW